MNQDFCTFGNFEEDTAFEPFPTNTTLPSYTSVESNSQLSSSPNHDTDSVSDKSKKIRKKRNTYQKIDDETRMKLLDAVSQGDTLKAAAKKFSVNYSSAKSILHTFRKEGRIFKKSAQERTPRKRTKTSSQDLEMSPIYLTNHHPDDYVVGLPETYNPQPYFSDYKYQKEGPIQSSPQSLELQRSNSSAMTINTFGNHLKIVGGSRQSSMENYNYNNSYTNEPQHQHQQAPPVHRDWQPTHPERVEKDQHYYNMREQPAQNINQYPPNIPDNCRTFDPIYVDLSKPQQIPANLNKREDYYRSRNPSEGYYQRNYPEMPTHVAHHDLGPAEQNSHDVSCFLNSSKGYNSQQRAPEQFYQNHERYPQNGQYRSNPEHQGQYPEGGVRGPYPTNYNMKFNENAPGIMKTASLKSY